MSRLFKNVDWGDVDWGGIALLAMFGTALYVVLHNSDAVVTAPRECTPHEGFVHGRHFGNECEYLKPPQIHSFSDWHGGCRVEDARGRTHLWSDSCADVYRQLNGKHTE